MKNPEMVYEGEKPPLDSCSGQVLPCIHELQIPLEKLNPHGGAIALGHPIEFSCAQLVTTLVHELRRRQGRYGLATMRIGVGRGSLWW